MVFDVLGPVRNVTSKESLTHASCDQAEKETNTPGIRSNNQNHLKIIIEKHTWTDHKTICQASPMHQPNAG